MCSKYSIHSEWYCNKRSVVRAAAALGEKEDAKDDG